MMKIVLLDAAWNGVDEGVQALLDKWSVAVGEHVVKGQAIATVVLVKASVDIEAPADGKLTSVLVKAEDSFSPGQVLAEFEPD